MIRFPRDWFGDPADLVPIGPAADAPAPPVEAPVLQQAPDAEAPFSAGVFAPEALSADDFWGESTAGLHQPVEMPVAPLEALPDPEPVTATFSPPAELHPGDAQPDRLVHASRRWALPRPPRLSLELPVRRRTVVLGFAALLLLLVAFVGPALVRTHAGPAPVIQRSSDLSALRNVVRSSAERVAKLAAGAEARASRRTVPHRTGASHRARHRVSRARTRAHAHTTVHTPARVTPSAPAATSIAAVSSSAGTSSGALRRVENSVAAAPAAAPVASRSAPVSRSAASSSSSSAGPAGPTGPGTAGSNCDPQCS